jgi:hypothetical protein
MKTRVLILLLLAPLLAGAERSCKVLDDSADDEPVAPSDPADPFLDEFAGGLVQWRLTAPIPNHQLGTGNPLPSLEVGSLSGLTTGGVTVRKFDLSKWLVVEADVFWLPPTPATTAPPRAWVGISDEDDPTGGQALAAGILIDSDGTVHFQVNGTDIGQSPNLQGLEWHRFTITMRADRVVEFRIDGGLALTGGSVDASHTARPVEACGIGYPERPRIDNVEARLP